MNLRCHLPNKHHIQGYRNAPSRGCQEVDGCEPDMSWLQHRTAAFSSLSLPRILAQSPKWASASSPACIPTPHPLQSCSSLYPDPSSFCPPRQGHSDTGNSHLPYILELLPGLLVDSGRQSAPGSKAAQGFPASPQAFLTWNTSFLFGFIWSEIQILFHPTPAVRPQ